VVLEGRDIGTVVFPDAEAKIFLTASEATRARRRVSDLESRGQKADYDATLRDIRLRDAQDSGRDVAPLRPADDAILVDTTDMGIDIVVGELAALVRTRST
jgi:CMP/dCMP kinase